VPDATPSRAGHVNAKLSRGTSMVRVISVDLVLLPGFHGLNGRLPSIHRSAINGPVTIAPTVPAIATPKMIQRAVLALTGLGSPAGRGAWLRPA
jgi:hypothetical protein